MPWPLQIAFRQLFPAGKRLPFFTFVAVVGVMLGVAVLIVVLSVMNGFGNQIRRMVVDTQGHVRVDTGGIIYHYNELREKVLAIEGVKAVAPFAQGMVMIQHANRPGFPVIQGIDPRHEAEVVPMERFLKSGALEDLDDDSILLSSGLAADLGARVGSEVEVYSPLVLEKLKRDEIFLPQRMRVVGIFETGWNQIDTNSAICTLRTMQDLYALGKGVHALKVRLQDGVDIDEAVARIQQQLGFPYRATSWLDSNRDFLFVLQLEKNMLMFLLLFIILVASFSITNSLLTTVVRKTREIGLFAALGARTGQVALCFCAQGLFIGVLGTLFGFALAALALHFRNDVIHAFARLTHSEAALLRFYQFANLPAEYSAHDLTVIAVATVIISTLAGVLPAWRAARMRPSEALRSE
ncbi:MAG: ABC transporter permease [Verrucomicrobia bacterium]|nr:MAG: ABC transporter permease [Verrucomicrobiota bacterium]